MSVDVTHDEDAQSAFVEVSAGGSGRATRLVTPTVLVGTRVLPGGDLAAVKKAIAAQQNW